MLNPEVEKPDVPSQPPKEMLTLTQENGKLTVKINYSSLDLIQTCLRKAHYSLNLKLKSHEESTALAFGSAIHKGLEVWYQLPVAERVLPRSLEETAEAYAYGEALGDSVSQGALEAIRQFARARYAVLSPLPEADKRSLASGVRILKAYFKHYAQDGFEILRAVGGPLVECRAEHTIFESEKLKINYFGTIDVVLQHKQSGVIVVADHKTTAALGKEFYNRCAPNHQYTGYVWLAQKALGIDTRQFMINGIQTAKTKTEFARQITERTEDDFEELKHAVVRSVQTYLEEKEVGQWPMTAPNPCSMYSGCTYRQICEMPEKLKAQIIKANYGQ